MDPLDPAATDRPLASRPGIQAWTDRVMAGMKRLHEEKVARLAAVARPLRDTDAQPASDEPPSPSGRAALPMPENFGHLDAAAQQAWIEAWVASIVEPPSKSGDCLAGRVTRGSAGLNEVHEDEAARLVTIPHLS